jgi:hypothetical protein
MAEIILVSSRNLPFIGIHLLAVLLNAAKEFIGLLRSHNAGELKQLLARSAPRLFRRKRMREVHYLPLERRRKPIEFL